MQSIDIERSSADFVDMIHKLSISGNNAKRMIFKKIIMADQASPYIFNDFLNDINDFLKFWDERSRKTMERVKNAEGIEGARTISYTFVREYVYDKNDFASVLEFGDNLISSLEHNKLRTDKDIENIFADKVMKAFNNQGTSVGALIDTVITNGVLLNEDRITSASKTLFKSIRSSRSLFDPRTRMVLSNSITKTLRYIVDTYLPKLECENNSDVKLIIAIINNIIEYIVYSATVYAARIYVIITYLESFSINEIRPYKTESVDPFITDGMNKTVFRDLEDSVYKDIVNGQEALFKAFNKFEKRELDCFTAMQDGLHGKISQKLQGNILLYLITGMIESKHSIENYMIKYAKEWNDILKAAIANRFQANGGIPTEMNDRQIILDTIANYGSEHQSISELEDDMHELYIFSAMLLRNMTKAMLEFADWNNRFRYPDESPINNPLNAQMVDGAHKILQSLYDDFITAIVYKARHIERLINFKKNDEARSIFNQITIKVPGEEKSDISLKYDMMVAVPDTLISQTDSKIMDLYKIPFMESYQMYSEYIASLPEFKDDMYFSEAGKLAEIYNSIKAKLKALLKRFGQFINDQRFKAGVEWVSKHREELNKMGIPAEYKFHVNLLYKKNVTLPPGFEKMVNGITGFNEKHVASAEAIDEFIKSLYPTQTIYDWFTKDDLKKDSDLKTKSGKVVSEGARRYRNLILFATNETDAANKFGGAELSGKDLVDAFNSWVDTTIAAPTVYQTYVNHDRSISNAVDAMNRQIVNLTSKINNTQQQMSEATLQAATPSTGNDTESANNNSNIGQDVAHGPQPNDTGVDSGKVELLNKASIAVDQVIDQLWGSVQAMLVQCMHDEYNYLRSVYSEVSAKNK